jgi:hypothetical protein
MSLFKRAVSLITLSLSIAHGQTPVPTTPSPLNGNWHLAGSRAPKKFPDLSMSVQVNGTQIFAHGWLQVRCSDSQTSGSGGSFGVDGTLAPDGSFTLFTRSPRNTNQITITGTAPFGPTSGNPAPTWSGTYRITSTSPYCSLDEKDAFTATSLASFAGTFRGSAFMYPGPGKNASLTLTVTQAGVVTRIIRTGAFRFYFPITATIQVSDSPCFTHGTAEASPYNTLEGDLSYLTFTMDDGSELHISSLFTDASESTLEVLTAYVKGGKCDQQGYINASLARQ